MTAKLTAFHYISDVVTLSTSMFELSVTIPPGLGRSSWKTELSVNCERFSPFFMPSLVACDPPQIRSCRPHWFRFGLKIRERATLAASPLKIYFARQQRFARFAAKNSQFFGKMGLLVLRTTPQITESLEQAISVLIARKWQAHFCEKNKKRS